MLKYKYKLLGKNVTKKELEVITQFLMELSFAASRGKIKQIYRGDSLTSLKEKLGINSTTADYDIFNRRIFLIGDKGVHFASNNPEFSIDDVSPGTFIYIFENLNRIAEREAKSYEFFLTENEGMSFFATATNLPVFLDRLRGCSIEDKMQVRNYYLQLLHQLAWPNYKPHSHLLSTSVDIKVAKIFSGIDVEDKIVLYGWEPGLFIKQKISRLLDRLNMPRYKDPYPKEKEISLLAGLLPHFLWGYLLAERNEFHINPAIMANNINQELFHNGINIDQRKFQEEISKTKYQKYFIVRGNKITESDI